jgi:DNA-binding LacI/PurR family transcriptional regulator
MPAKPDPTVWEQRSLGLRDVLGPAGVTVADEDVFTPGDCHAPDGQAAMEALLSRPGPRPTAIFCHTDEMAFGAMAMLRRNGVRTPEEISIAGFDDHPMARYWGLTTVSQHAHQQGIRAAYALVDVLEGEVPERVCRPDADLQVELVVRETTAPARHS